MLAYSMMGRIHDVYMALRVLRSAPQAFPDIALNAFNLVVTLSRTRRMCCCMVRFLSSSTPRSLMWFDGDTVIISLLM